MDILGYAIMHEVLNELDEMEKSDSSSRNDSPTAGCSVIGCHHPTLVRCGVCNGYYCFNHVKQVNHNCKGKPIKKQSMFSRLFKRQNSMINNRSES